jgi:hypothetical protein
MTQDMDSRLRGNDGALVSKEKKLNRFQCSQSGRARRRCDGRADCGPPGQRARCRWCCSTCLPKKVPKTASSPRPWMGLKKLKPAPLGIPEDAALIRAGQLRRASVNCCSSCDLIIEAIAERHGLEAGPLPAHRIAPFIAPHAIVASNTSGLSITKLSDVLPEAIRPRFCGIHFFNPRVT